MKNKALMNTAIGAALAASFCATTPAIALEAKQCLPMAEMNAALKADGQRTMIIGDRMTVNDDASRRAGVRVTRYVNTVTSNPDGSRGYQLEGDLPRAETSTNVCVVSRLTNVRLYDARRPGIPQAAYLGGRFDEVVKLNEAKGTRPMVVADSVHVASNGLDRRGLSIVVFGNVARRNASIQTRLTDGSPLELALMGDTDYTPAALARLGTQVAMVTPR